MLGRLKRSVAELIRIAVRDGTRDAQIPPYEVRPAGIERDALGHLAALRQDQWLSKEALGFLAEEALLYLDPRCRDPRFLGRYAAKIFSQNYEDAIVAEIFARIGEASRRFIEIGTGNGTENTTRFLSMLGWSGLWLEGSPDNVREARQGMAPTIGEGRLQIIEAMVEPVNVNELLSGTPFATEVDYLSVDIDQNTSHVWRALNVTARVAFIEYNAAIPPSVAYEVPFVSGRVWDLTNDYGASLKMLERIGAEKNMSLVGCDLHGANAFFVRNDLLGDKFLAPFTAEQHFQPARFSLSRPRGHQRPGWPQPSGRG